jgi:glycosyltransferase involved in cell wall biosynthesis
VKKKLVILTQYYLPEMGAPQSRLYEMATGLKKLGWDVRVVAAMPNYPTGKIFDAYKGKMFKMETISSIPVYRYTLYASNAKKRLPRIFSMVSFSMMSLFSFPRLRKFKPDYIFTESPPLTLAATGLMLAKLTGAKHIMNVSDIWPLSAYELGALTNGFFYRNLQKLETYLYKSSFACTGQSQQIVDYLSKKGSKRSHLFRNGVDTSRFHSNGKPARETKLRIVYVGLLGMAQGILRVCRNIDFDKAGAEFHIYGDGAEKNEITAFLTNNNTKGIYLHAPISRDEVPGILPGYDITLIPLIKPIYGAIPSKIYEAMAAGLPILFTGGGEGAELIEKHGTGWTCAPSDYKNIEARIAAIAAMDDYALTHIRNNCIAAAKNVFDRNIQIEQLHHYLSKG